MKAKSHKDNSTKHTIFEQESHTASKNTSHTQSPTKFQTQYLAYRQNTERMVQVVLKRLRSIPVGVVYFISLLGALFIQHRYFIFDSLYQGFSDRMGTEGDAYYNLSIFMQNTLSLLLGRFFSLQGDHHTWWGSIMGVTGHGWAATLVFAPLYFLTNNPILVYNIIFFGNLALLQIGMFLLIKKLTDNYFLGIFSALMIPLSPSFLTFYVAHIHASYYWFLPFLILVLELLFDPAKKIFSRLQLFGLYTLFALCIYWLLFGDWHVMLFGAILPLVWMSFKLKNIIENFGFFKWRLVVTSAISVVIGLSALPLVLGTYNASQTFNTVRSIADVAGTLSNTSENMGYKFVIIPVFELGVRLVPETYSLNQYMNESLASIKDSPSQFPDIFTILIFWICVFLFVPWTLLLLVRKGRFFTKEYALMISLFISVIILTGPFVKVDGATNFQYKLPFYYLRQIIPPLQAIRALWRAIIIAYISALILFSMIVSKAWNRLDFSSLPRYTKPLIISYSTAALLIVMFIVNQGFSGASKPAFRYDSELAASLDTVYQKNSLDTYVWRIPGNWADAKTEYYSYQFSWYNLKNKKQIINWIGGGTAGAAADEYAILFGAPQAGVHYDVLADILAAKKVDVVIEELKTPLSTGLDHQKDYNYHFETTNKVLSQYYTPVQKSQDRVIWKLTTDFPADRKTSDLTFSLAASQYQTSAHNLAFFVTIENVTDKIYANPRQVTPSTFEFQVLQNGKVLSNKAFKIGLPAFLPQRQGLSYDRSMDLGNVKPGDGVFRVLLDDKIVSQKSLKILSNQDYQAKLLTAKSTPLTLDTTKTNQIFNFGYPDFIYLIPVPITLNVTGGGIDNLNKDTLADKSDIVVVSYASTSSTPDSLPLPDGYLQPPCPLPLNLFEGDEITIWCKQYSPKNLNQTYVTYPFVKKTD